MTSGVKTPEVLGLFGTAEAVPWRNPFYEETESTKGHREAPGKNKKSRRDAGGTKGD